jgi:LmbE family N-acetylglucosaminyl deacetylase
MKRIQNVLVFGPHPDDLEVGRWGTLAKLCADDLKG